MDFFFIFVKVYLHNMLVAGTGFFFLHHLSSSMTYLHISVVKNTIDQVITKENVGGFHWSFYYHSDFCIPGKLVLWAKKYLFVDE